MATARADAMLEAGQGLARPSVARHRTRMRALLGSPIGVSLLVHALVLAMLTLVMAEAGASRPVRLTMLEAAAADVDEIDLAPLVIEPSREPALEPAPAEPSVETVAVAVEPLDLGDAVPVDLGDVALADLVPGPSTGDFGLEFGPSPTRAATSFFGTTVSGRRFVFVLDNSNSMANGRLETAFAELMRAVDGLGPEQSFSVILFSDTAYRMFHPDPAPTLVPGTAENKRRLREWLETVEMCLTTRGEAAVEAAVAMQPDVISILGDGRFTDRATQLLTAPHGRRIVINTYGMQVDPAGRRELAAIARANNGSFRMVETSATAVALARSRPIRRNTTRGEVWGVSLPPGPGK